jgi:uncharacterized protein with HEPN domain
VKKDVKLKYPDIPWKFISAIRNKLVHNYDGIDTSIVWETVKNDIPELKKKIEKILYNEDELLDDK